MSDKVVVDASALLAVYLDEAGADRFEAVIAGAPCVIAGPGLLETYMKIAIHVSVEKAADYLDYLRARIDIVDLTEAMTVAACEAYGRHGKGLGHGKKGLNFGDCLAYAVAMELDAPLLFKGGEFGATDVKIHDASVLL